jgi:hypothetical protein
MCRVKTATFILSLVMLLCFCGTAMAQMVTFASSTFRTSSVGFSSAGKATFSATTTKNCASIKVSSCTLQVKSGSSWNDAKLLTAPAGDTNCSSYYATKSYGSDLTSGKTYRLKAVFNADGNTVTCYSGEISY